MQLHAKHLEWILSHFVIVFVTWNTITLVISTQLY
jgi:hypothetical protein